GSRPKSTETARRLLEALVFAPGTPLARRPVTQSPPADTHPLEPHDFQADQFAHAPDLPSFAFAQHKAKLVGILPVHLRGPQRLAIQAQPMIKQGKAALVQPSRAADQIALGDISIFAG